MANLNPLRACLFLVVALAFGGCNEVEESGGETCEASECNELAESGSETCEAYEGDACTPEETRECISGFLQSDGSYARGTERCNLVEGCKTEWSGFCEYNTPIVLSFDGSEPKMVAEPLHQFDLGGGKGVVTDWVSAATPWLTMDRNGNETIDDGTELFGSMTPLAAGGRGRHGFTALRELDADGDGALTPLDPSFEKLGLWRDANTDRSSTAGEMVSAANARIIAIDLAFVSAPVCDDRGNCAVERAPFYWLDEHDAIRTGSAIDVHFAAQSR